MRFEKNCISLLIGAYSDAITTSRDFKVFNENDITAQLVGFMKTNPLRKNLNISIGREAYIDSEEVLQGMASADESVRIDIRFVVWNSDDEYEYHMEAKNLSETNWIKLPKNTTVDAGALHHRYIRTGIDNFVSGKYVEGCLLGYVLQGDPDKVVQKINIILVSKGREKEQLRQELGIGNYKYFISEYPNSTTNRLSHFFLKFS